MILLICDKENNIMSGVSEITKKNLDRIENVLQNKPDYLRGFVNFMNDSSIQTKYYYLCHVCAFVEYVNKEPENLTFDDFNNYMMKISYKEDGTEMTSSYRINIYSALKKFNEYLYVSKKLEQNYMLYIKRPKPKESQRTITKRENGYLNEKEIKDYLDELDCQMELKKIENRQWITRDKAIIHTLLTTGIRNTALRMLDVDDVDMEKKELIVTDKGGKVRRYEMSDKLCFTMSCWLSWRNDAIMLDNKECKALFISNRKRRMDAYTLNEIVKKYTHDEDGNSLVDNKKITAHKLRATYGTQLYNKTGDIYFVQQCMGHSNPKTTELYVREKKQNTKRASEIMDKFL
jgi:site-specific recombinase XerD